MENKIIKLPTTYEIVPCSKSTLLKLYRPITLYVLNKYLAAIEDQTGPIIAKTLSPKQMAIFIEAYGPPRQRTNEPVKTELKQAA